MLEAFFKHLTTVDRESTFIIIKLIIKYLNPDWALYLGKEFSTSEFVLGQRLSILLDAMTTFFQGKYFKNLHLLP